MNFKDYITEATIKGAFFISPRGELITTKGTHIDTIIKYPKKFGLTKEYIEGVYDKYDEKIGQEGSARRVIIKKLMKSGWIRIRRYPNKFWSVQLSKLNNKTKDYLHDWANRILKGTQGFREDDKFMPVKIDTLSKFYTYHGKLTVDKISNDVLYNESVTHKREMLIEKRIEDLSESSLSRIWQFVEEEKKPFAVISAYKGTYSNKENEKNHVELKKMVREIGYGFIEMKGGYREDGGFVNEKLLFIASITKKEAVELGKYFKQEGILYKDSKAFVEIDPVNNSITSKFLKSTNSNNISLNKKIIMDFFSRLLKGSHKNKKFVFNKIRLEEKTHVWAYGRMGGRKPEWLRIN